MLPLNICIVVLILAVYAVCQTVRLWLQRLPERPRQLSSHVPSVTRSMWDELLFSWSVAMKHPRDLLPFFMDLIRKNGPVVHFNLLGRSYVSLNNPDDIKILLSSQENIDKGPEYDMLKPWLNEGLLLSSGIKWRNRRKLLNNTFHNIKLCNSSINKNSRMLVKNLLKESAASKNISYIMKCVNLCSLDIICETITGSEMKAQEGLSVQYVKSIKKVYGFLMERVLKFWFWNDSSLSASDRLFYKSLSVLHKYTDKVIEKKMTCFNNERIYSYPPSENEYEKKSFLEALINGLKDYPDQMNVNNDIREEIDTFFFAGLNKSSLAITITLLLLGMHQDIQDCARNELRSIFGASDRDVTMDDLAAMKYVDAVVKESLRLYPSVPYITRTLRTTLKLKNYTIPPKTIVAVFPYILHRNEDIFPNPEEFIPERFLDEANNSKFLYGYLPFSAGPRNCIGQNFALNVVKIVVSNILRRTKIETIGTKEDIHIRMEMIMGIESIPKMKYFKI